METKAILSTPHYALYPDFMKVIQNRKQLGRIQTLYQILNAREARKDVACGRGALPGCPVKLQGSNFIELVCFKSLKDFLMRLKAGKTTGKSKISPCYGIQTPIAQNLDTVLLG